MNRRIPIALLSLLIGTTGCSMKRFAANRIANVLATGGTTFESDEDPELVAESLPFALKMMESVLAETPRHAGLLLAAASGFTEYGYAFVGTAADRRFGENVAESNELRSRARKLYLRGQQYGMRALEVRYRGFAGEFERDPKAALARIRVRDVPLLYWTAAAHGLAISASKDDMEMIAQLPQVEALIRRASELDAGWNQGALPEFLISLESAHTDTSPQRKKRLERYFERALRLSGGRRASLFVASAETLCIPYQDRSRFRQMLERALEINPDQYPNLRLANLIAQRRARWLLSRTGELFLDAESATETPDQEDER